MAEKRPALGRGLSALIPDTAPPPRAVVVERERPLELDTDRLLPNPRQPRRQFSDLRLEELAQSIRANGVIQPIVVRRSPQPAASAAEARYEIIAGERRWRAAQQAGLLKVPVVVRDVADDKLLEVALIENIQRENLNPIEEAEAYRRLADDHRLSQDQMASAVGKDRATIANYMRLLRLPEEVKNDVAAGSLSMGHARAILGLADEAAQRRIAREAVSRGLSVRETESIVRKESEPVKRGESPKLDPNTRAAEDRLRHALGTRVRIIRKGTGGRIEVDFASEDELQRLYEHIVS